MNSGRTRPQVLQRIAVTQAQAALAALIPEIEALAWKFFGIGRSLGARVWPELGVGS